MNVAFEIYDSVNHDVFKYFHIMQSWIRLCLVTTAERRDVLTWCAQCSTVYVDVVYRVSCLTHDSKASYFERQCCVTVIKSALINYSELKRRVCLEFQTSNVTYSIKTTFTLLKVEKDISERSPELYYITFAWEKMS